MISNDYEFIFPDGGCIGTDSQGLPLSPKPPHSDISSSSSPIASADIYVRPCSAPPCPLPTNTNPLSNPALEAPLCHATPLLSSCIRFIDENHSVCFGQDVKQDNSKHIPRPPNAFMLYRSDFLKKGTIPPEIEKRQQNLSRIAGQCWNMLSESEKAIWHDRAAAIQATHYAKYPSYKFRPSRKEASRRSAKEKGEYQLADRAKASIRSLREEYASIGGHSSGQGTHSRSHRRCTRKSDHHEYLFAAFHDPLPLSYLSPDSSDSTASESSASASSPLSPLSPLSLPTLLPPFTSLMTSRGLVPSSTASRNYFAQWPKKDCYQLSSPTTENPQMGLSDMIRGLEIAPPFITPYQVSDPMLQESYQDAFGSSFPTLGLGQPPVPQNDSMLQVHLGLPESNACSHLSYQAGDLHLQIPDLDSMHDFATFHPLDMPWYPYSPRIESGNNGSSSSWITQTGL